MGFSCEVGVGHTNKRSTADSIDEKNTSKDTNCPNRSMRSSRKVNKGDSASLISECLTIENERYVACHTQGSKDDWEIIGDTINLDGHCQQTLTTIERRPYPGAL